MRPRKIMRLFSVVAKFASLDSDFAQTVSEKKKKNEFVPILLGAVVRLRETSHNIIVG